MDKQVKVLERTADSLEVLVKIETEGG